MKKLSIILLIAIMFLTACSIDIGSKSVPDLDGTAWNLIKINDKDALESTTVTISFDGSDVSGNGGCNHYGGGVTKDSDGNMEFGMLFMTEMYCLEDGVSDQEYEFFSALDEVMTFESKGGNLLMLNEGGDTILEFVPQT
jgi:heat shock protein HslJ